MEIKGRVVVFSIIGCSHCMKAKNNLQQLDVPYTDVNLDAFPRCRDYLKEKTGKYTVPQIFFNNIFIGGNDDLIRACTCKLYVVDLFSDLLGDFACEPNEYAILTQDLKSSGLIRDHHRGLSVYKRSFTGKEFVDWIVKNKQLDRECAVEMGQALIDQHFGADINKYQIIFKDDETIYRLLEDDQSTALNAGTVSQCEPRPVDAVGEQIRKLILSIYSAFLTDGGKKVDYQGISASSEFEKYKNLTKELIRVELESATHEEKLAFFINIYNALVIHANIVKGPPTNLWQRYKFFNTVSYLIGGHTYSLQDIENGILRRNKKGVGMLYKPFSKTDPRVKLTLEKPEPLVHFALVCGSKSCPPIKTYSAEDINIQLQMAAEAFLDGDNGLQISMDKKEIKLSMIFKWYREDFGQNVDELLRFLYEYMAKGEKKDQLTQLLTDKKYKVRYMSYDWSVNN
ncbi:hypothetical protein LSH36_68g04032 [Paralvinella palmiformis]|uniref:DEP domain-containing protein n=1 Tax=Paralvinella palmiformis TaxID=53620 RepID=A0AAD9NED4_9ANNE|nr:hypothetical protein LSH36_68g04032 [Paralvinella palmiformis]